MIDQKLLSAIFWGILFLLFLFTLSSCDKNRYAQETDQLNNLSKLPEEPLFSYETPAQDNQTLFDSTHIPNPGLEPSATPEPEQDDSDLPLLRGMNIGDALDAPLPGQWGVTINQEMIEAIADAGFNAIRIPVRFSAQTSGPPDFLINADFLKLVDDLITWGLEYDLTVILDLHHFEEIMQDPVNQRIHFLAIWQQLAEHYQELPEELYFELLNEPSINIDSTYWNDLVEECVQLIRKTNPTRKIIIGGINYSTIDSLYLLNPPIDNNLIASFHFYEPFEFTHQGASWVEDSSNWLGRTWEGTLAEKHHIRTLFDRAEEWSNYHKIPILMGEFGVIQIADPGSKINWVNYVVQQAEKREIGWGFWSLCSNFAIYDCEHLEWDEPMLEALINQ